MSAANKRRGAQWELDLLKGFRGEGIRAERLRLSGRLDEGDLAVEDLGHIYVVEAKDEARINLPGYLAEAQAEAVNYAKARGLRADDITPLAIVKRRGKGWLDAYVVQDVRTFFDLGGK